MKTYFYGEPSRTLVKIAYAVKKRAKWMKVPVLIVLVLIWSVLMPPARLFIWLGEIGHSIAEFCGFDSRDW